MANKANANTFFVDTASSNAVAESFIAEKDILLQGVIYTGEASHAHVDLADLAYSNGENKAGDKKMHLHGVADSMQHIDLSDSPIRFPNGIWISACVGCEITLIIKRKG